MRWPRRAAAPAAAVAAVVLLLGLSVGPAGAATITSPGPLTAIETTPDLNCAVNHADDVEGEWFQDTACGTLVATGGVLYGPADIPAGEHATPRTPWTPVSQTMSGTGTVADPFTIITEVTGGPLAVHQVDSYVTGQESYRTDVTVTNTSGAPISAIVYRAGDCYLANSDEGFGRVDPAGAGTAVSCVDSVGGAPGSRVEQLLPLTPGSDYMEATYSLVWATIGDQEPLPNTCECAEEVDNGIGLSWTVTLAPGASATFSELTTFSPGGALPVVAAKTADNPIAYADLDEGYTVTFNNPNSTAATLDSITDTLPTGFAYVAGTTTGGITTDPAVSGQELTWTGPFTVPAGGDLTFHFEVTVPVTEGVYTNDVTATSATHTVAPAVNAASILVPPIGAIPLVPAEGIPVAAATVVLVGLALWARVRRHSRPA